MDKDFMKYIYARIESVLKNDDDYMRLTDLIADAQMKENIETERDLKNQREDRAEELCYIKGYKDCMKLLLGLNLEERE
jgi:hypothetical protein